MSSLFKKEVVIADMDLPYGTANINFDQDPAQGIAEAVFSPERIDDVYLDRLLAQCAESCRCWPRHRRSTGLRFYAEAILCTPDRRGATIRSPRHSRRAAHMELAGRSTTLARADEVVIIASPELANLRNTKNLLDTLKQRPPNDAPPKLVLNQVGVSEAP